MTDDLLEAEVRVALALAEDDHDTLVAELAGEHPAAARAVAAGLAAYRREQRGWGDRMTDAERFLAACRDLDAAGIAARADYTCCRECGLRGVAVEAQDVRGYVFCHRQGVRAAARGEGLALVYGTLAGDPAAIAGEVAAALTGRGLAAPVPRDGDLWLPLTWRRRRYGRLDRWPGAPEAERGPLTVSFHDEARERSEEEQPMSFAACRGVLYDLVPVPGSFLVCAGASGAVAQAVWEPGPRLWMETPDGAARRSHGRHVTPDEAVSVIRALAERDRVTLGGLGPLEVVHW
ncbi:DUF6891 domain-containing protein [Actinomadura kijaniata]|uniref:DUF6891 domain-containing protein n=1 Tax=Actinomadura kijaniata TaxID=46161 RepID=UPI003F1E19BF